MNVLMYVSLFWPVPKTSFNDTNFAFGGGGEEGGTLLFSKLYVRMLFSNMLKISFGYRDRCGFE